MNRLKFWLSAPVILAIMAVIAPPAAAQYVGTMSCTSTPPAGLPNPYLGTVTCNGVTGSMTWPATPGVPTCTGTACTAWGTTLTKFGSAAGVATSADPGATAEVPMVADGTHGQKPSASGALNTGAFAATGLPIGGGTLTGGLLFTDNTYDIGANGATRPRTGYFGTSVIAPAIAETTTTALVQAIAAKNTTAALVGTSQGSPFLAACGRAFHGSADVEDCMTFGELAGNGNDAAIVFNYGHTGTSTGTVTHTFAGNITASGTIDATKLSGNITVPTGTSIICQSGSTCPGQISSIVFQFGTPGGSPISAGILGYQTVPFACTISGWSIQVDGGTATVKTLKVASGTAIPTLGSNSISTSGVAIASGTAIQSTTVTDFTTATVSANDIVAADLITTSGVGYISFELVCHQ